MKKTIALVLAFVLVAAVSVIGTVAYLTDRDSEINTFTIGDVDIELNENFEQGSQLIPGVDINKDVTITNTGDSDAYVWYTYAVPTALVDEGNNASKNAIHFNLEGAYWDSYYDKEQHYKAAGLDAPVDISDTWNWYGIAHNVDYLGDGEMYTVVTCLYNGAIVSGETTNVGLTNVYLDTRVDIDPDGNMYWVENGVATDLNWNVNEKGAPSIYVAAYAVQADGFATAEAAYNAYSKQWGTNDNATFTTPSDVADEEALKAALANGEDVVLTEDITLTSFVDITAAGEIDINLNGNSINRADGTAIYVNNEDAVVNIKGNGEITGVDGVFVNAGTVNIYDGVYTNNGNVTIYAASENAVINIYGGTYSSNSPEGTDKWVLNLKDGSNGTINVYGGTFINFDPADNSSEGAGTDFVADGYKSVDNGDGTWTVVAE